MAIGTSTFRRLSEALSGDLILPGDPQYDKARRVWNGDIDKYPAAVVACSTEKDVAAAIRFGRDHDLSIAVQSGGHSFPGLSTCDDGLVISLANMRGAEWVPGAELRIRVAGGSLLHDLDAKTQEAGRAVPAGVVSHTGVAGLTLGGGYGYLSRRWGLSCDNMRAVRLVTAGGCIVTVNEDEDPELMWGLRGGGGNFGVVTEFEFDTHPLGQVLSGWLVYPFEQAKAFLELFRDFTSDMPRELTVMLRVRTSGTSDIVPSNLRSSGRDFIAVCPVWSGEIGSGLEILAPLRTWREPVYDGITVRSYCEQQRSIDSGVPHGVRRYERAGYFDTITDGLVDDLLNALSQMRGCDVSILCLGGRIADIDENATAFSSRKSLFEYEVHTSFSNDDERSHRVDAVRRTWEIINRHAVGGVYVNLVFDESGQGARASYGPLKFDRLRSLKSRIDPDNIFRLNQNIPPSTTTAS